MPATYGCLSTELLEPPPREHHTAKHGNPADDLVRRKHKNIYLSVVSYHVENTDDDDGARKKGDESNRKRLNVLRANISQRLLPSH